ncbi:MAG: Hsp20/alpha crystallin family protein [Chloroflexota bacterium]
MMNTYLVPRRRRMHMHPALSNDRVARQMGMVNSDVHIPLDVKEEADAFVIYATIPGLNAEDLKIEILNRVVDIQGEFTQDEDGDNEYLRRERPVGKFHRRLRFTNKLDSAKVEATLKNGVLSLRIPKIEAEQPKSIQVKVK